MEISWVMINLIYLIKIFKETIKKSLNLRQVQILCFRMFVSICNQPFSKRLFFIDTGIKIT